MRSAPTLPARIQSCTPWRDGMSPVSSDARAGEHTGEAQKKSVKRMPARGDAVERRRDDVGVARAAHRPRALVVAQDEEDVGTLRIPAGHADLRGSPSREAAAIARHHDAAVDVERGAGGEVAIVGRDEQRHARDLLDGAEAPERRARVDARHHLVEPDALRPPRRRASPACPAPWESGPGRSR